MRIAEKPIRSLCLCMLVSAGLVLFSFPRQPVVWPASSGIESMTMAELDRLITGNQGMQVLFFTASWCGHCKAMLPTLNRLYRRFHSKGLYFTAVSIDASIGAMQRVVEKQVVDFPVVWVGETAVDKFRLVGIPMIFLIRKGTPVEKIPGKCSYTFLESKIQDLIK